MEYPFQNFFRQFADQRDTVTDPTGTATNTGRKQTQRAAKAIMQLPDKCGFLDHFPIPGLATGQMDHKRFLL
ncbi:MAG TPA: hypothetical protein DCS88_10795 [Alphaproteobacteria bacterium]|nr:hypothetical protein [Alphaproteobacteria bacterium]